MKVTDPSSPTPLTRLQILMKLVDEWKGETELKLRDLETQYNKNWYHTDIESIDYVTNQGLFKVSIANCELFTKLINQVNIQCPPTRDDDDYYYYDDY